MALQIILPIAVTVAVATAAVKLLKGLNETWNQRRIEKAKELSEKLAEAAKGGDIIVDIGIWRSPSEKYDQFFCNLRETLTLLEIKTTIRKNDVDELIRRKIPNYDTACERIKEFTDAGLISISEDQIPDYNVASNYNNMRLYLLAARDSNRKIFMVTNQNVIRKQRSKQYGFKNSVYFSDELTPQIEDIVSFNNPD